MRDRNSGVEALDGRLSQRVLSTFGQKVPKLKAKKYRFIEILGEI